jgi:hypothetical protein
MTQLLTTAASPSPVAPVPREDLPGPMLWVTRVARIQKACVAMHFSCAMDHRSIAAALGVSERTVGVLIRAALREVGAPSRDIVEQVERPPRRTILEPASLPWPAAPPERVVGWYRHPDNARVHQYWDGFAWIPWVPDQANGTPDDRRR